MIAVGRAHAGSGCGSSAPRRGPSRHRRVALALAPLAWCIAGALHAQVAPGMDYTQNDFGETGLLQTPTARMSEDGEVGVSFNRVEPYSRFNVFAQPFDWLEATARYTIVSNRLYPLSKTPQRYKDKSIDAKIRLLSESRYWPAIAVGVRDLAGTGLFSSEYVVGSKRFGNFDVSLGLAWGYMGGRGNLPNPFGLISDSFDHRPASTGIGATGKFTASRYFHGRTALFGGVEYQTPVEWLRLKAELDGNDYQHEPQANNQVQRWPINLGALFRVNHFVDLSLGYERGDTVMATVTLHDNIGHRGDAPKPFDPPPEPIRPLDTAPAAVAPTQAAAPDVAQAPVRHSTAQTDWKAVSDVLLANAGIRVERIAQRGAELLVYGQQERFYYDPEGLGRAARVLHNRLDAGIDWITFVPTVYGLPIVEDSVRRSRLVAYLDHDIPLSRLRRSVEQDPTAAQAEQVLYTAPLKRWDFSIGPGYHQIFGTPDKPLVYQFTAKGSTTFHFTRNLWLDATVEGNLLNNFAGTSYNPPSLLPRVRTDARKYLVSSDVTMPNLQLTWTHQLGPDVYGMLYGGMLESMFGGVGGEWLYRPLHQRWAFGFDANFVRQRGFKQNFAFRHYQVATGQATLYYDTGWHGLQTNLSFGRYLAGDWGTTLDVSRKFHNGVRMGAWATFTTAGSRYGEGSFDKGFYVSVPFDLFLPVSRSSSQYMYWEPLVRDGGARLHKSYYLYDMTIYRDSDVFDQNVDKIGQ